MLVKRAYILGAVVAYIGALALFTLARAPQPSPVAPSFVPLPPVSPAVPTAPLVESTQATETTIALTPQEHTVIIGREFPLAVTVDAAQPINAVGAQIKFPQEYLTVVNLSKEGSVLNVWPEEPSFSNETGTISFSGISTAGGVQGKRTALTVVLKSKKVGSAQIDVADAQALAHDGQGTDILKKKIGGTYTIVEKPPPPSADINGDGKIGLADVSIMVFHVGKTNAAAVRYDLNGDGKVNLTDLSILVSLMGKK